VTKTATTTNATIRDASFILLNMDFPRSATLKKRENFVYFYFYS